MNVIVLWNTIYMDAVLNQLRAEGFDVCDADVKLRDAAAERIAPLIVARDRAAGALAGEREVAVQVELRAQLATLAAHAERQADLLGRTIDAITDLERRTDHVGRPTWAPSRPMYDSLRRQAVLSGVL